MCASIAVGSHHSGSDGYDGNQRERVLRVGMNRIDLEPALAMRPFVTALGGIQSGGIYLSVPAAFLE
jgi:hypothetical protein